MSSEEIELRRTLDELKEKKLAFQRQNNQSELRQIDLSAVELLAKLAQLRAHDYDFSAAETSLQVLEQLVYDLSENAAPEEKLGLEGRLFHTIAIVNDAWGTYDLFERMDYVDGAVRLERAEKMYELTADAASKLDVDKNTVQAMQGQAQRARGLRLFGLGRYDIEAADTIKAEKELEEATEVLKQASNLLVNARGLDARSGMHPAYSNSMAAYAQGFLSRARADSSAFVGNYKKSSKLLSEQIKAFQQAKQPLLSLTSKIAESMAHRIAQEMDLCEKRQRHFASRPTTQARSPLSLATILFAVLTVVTLFFQLWGATRFGIADRNIIFYVIALAFSILVGGVGAGLAAWGEATAFFKEIIGAVQKTTK
jgi:hypothetical protein